MHQHRRRTSPATTFLVGALLVGAVVAAVPAVPGWPSAEPVVEADAPPPRTAVVPTPTARPSISADGRWLAVEALVAADGTRLDPTVPTPGARRTVLRVDRLSGEAVDLVVPPAGIRSGDTVHPVISDDGCTVVAQSQLALDLFRDDDRDERWDVYRTVLPECGGTLGDWELVSTDDRGVARDDVVVADPPTVSGSGSVVAFTVPLPGDATVVDGVSTIHVVDLTVPVGQPGRIQEVAGMPVEAPATAYRYEGARTPVLSGDGRFLAFRADVTASDALPGWAEGQVAGGPATAQVYVWDRADTDRFTAVKLVSGVDGAPSAAGAAEPAISDDGRIVVFTSTDQRFVAAVHPSCASGCPRQVYRYDRDADGNGRYDEPGTTEMLLVSALRDLDDERTPPRAGDRSSWAPAVNVDGSQVAFVTDATDLVTPPAAGGGEALDGDIVVVDVGIGRPERVATTPAGTTPAAVHAAPVLSATGRVVAFDTAVAGQIAGDPALAGRHVVSVVRAPSLSLAAVDFGSVIPDWTSEELYVSVLNDGPGAFAPTTVTSSSTRFRITDGGTCRDGVVVPAGGTCTVYLVFEPGGAGTARGTISVLESGVDAIAVSTEVRGEGGGPELQVQPKGLDLDATVVGGTPRRAAFDVQNVSFNPTRITDIRVDGVNAGDFRVTGQSCTGRPFNPGAYCYVEVEFAPTAAGRRTASVVVRSTTGAYTAVIVSGTGRYEPVIETDGLQVTPGGRLGVGGSGFPADTDVTLEFAPGGRPFATVRTSAEGTLLAEVIVPVDERTGRRQLVASAPAAVATVEVEVEAVRATFQPGMPGGAFRP
jgi:hypothetical protein